MITKKCSKCGEEKLLAVFYKQLDGPHGRTSNCKTCILKQRKRYRQDNAVKISEGRHAWRLRNPEKAREDDAAHRQRTEKARRAYNKAYRAKRPGFELSLTQNRRAKKKAAYIEHVDAATVYQRDLGLCQICGVVVEAGDFNLDHKIPFSKGGLHSYSNCQTAHASCNHRKHIKLPSECAHLWLRG